jgi:N-hydroxyarylamine O-acetyltransferase
MNLTNYLQRINYTGSIAPNLETLRQLHKAHLYAIPYENLDIHLGRTLELSEQAFYEKLVLQKRGGWCYEMNGLFAWVLRECGFEVQLLAGAVRGATTQVEQVGNHLALLVRLEGSYYIADVGLGDGFLEPLPLQVGEYTQEFLKFSLAQEGPYWVFYNHPNGGAKRYDFQLEPHPLAYFAAKCHELQTSPTSGFVRVIDCQRFTPYAILILKGAIFKKISADGVVQSVIKSAEEYYQILVEQIGLDIGYSATLGLWPKIWEAHQEWLQQLQQHKPSN